MPRATTPTYAWRALLLSSALASLLTVTACTSTPDSSEPTTTRTPSPNTPGTDAPASVTPLPAPTTSEPTAGGWDLEETLPFWNPAKETPSSTSAQQLADIAETRGWTPHTEPGEPGSLTYLTDTDAAINLVMVDNDSGTLGQLKPDDHIPFFQGASDRDLLEPSTGYLDSGYHFPAQTGSWVAWKIKSGLTPGRIRSFRYRVAHGPAPLWQMAIRQNDTTYLAQYTPEPHTREVTVPLDSTTRAWTLLDGSHKTLKSNLTWTEILNWPTPAGWSETTLGDSTIAPATTPSDGSNGTNFLPGDPSGVRLITTANQHSHLTMLEYGFYWPENKRDYLQIRNFLMDNPNASQPDSPHPGSS